MAPPKTRSPEDHPDDSRDDSRDEGFELNDDALEGVAGGEDPPPPPRPPAE